MRLFLSVICTVFFLAFFVPSAQATHSWGGYHWARTSNPFTLKLGDNLAPGWKSYLGTTSANWNNSTVLHTTVVPGGTTSRRCRPTNGRVEVCNNMYGSNGWLGLAQIWVSGLHITEGVTKLNDTYFSTPYYNNPAWRNFVVCQEVGHTFGLDHQDINFSNPNLGTCMDYTDDPDGTLKNQLSNEQPNQHDFDELAIIYGHLDGFTTLQSSIQRLPSGSSTVKGAEDGDFEDKREWGKELKNNKKVALYERDFGGGRKLYTFIIVAQ